MNTLHTSTPFKEWGTYLLMAILFIFAITFCVINTYEFIKLLHDDPNDDLEVSHAYTWFLIIFNAFFGFLFLILLIMSIWLLIKPRGDNWVRNLLGKLKIFKNVSYDALKQEQKKIIDAYQPKITATGLTAASEKLRGPKITYTCPKDRETPIPVMNEPIKRITLGDFEPYGINKNTVVPMTKQPLTLDNLKQLYFSKKVSR